MINSKQWPMMTYEQSSLFSEAIKAGFSEDEALQYAGFVLLNGQWTASLATQEEAIDYVDSIADDYCSDNFRFAFDDEQLAIDTYEDQKAHGCCGFLDLPVVVGGRPAMVGCNYGH